jgi:hypothetical protein
MAIGQRKDDKELVGKEKLEINMVGDGRVYLNFWDWAHGNDVIVQIVNDKLLLVQEDNSQKEINFIDFFNLVKKSILSRDSDLLNLKE